MSVLASNQFHPKALGAFYTPATIAEVLAAWVVRDGAERLLEPSVGEGALILAAINRAEAVLGGSSRIQFVACDINPDAVEAIVSKLPPGSEARAVDFLQLDPSSTGRFQGVLANPPFTRNHAMPAPWRAALRERFNIVGSAGLWVHFLIHAKAFLAPGGRLAAVIPASALFTAYGRNALERVAGEFRHVEIWQIADKPPWVNGADERGALVLAEGYREGSSVVPVAAPWSTRGERVPPISGIAEVFDALAETAVPLGAIAALNIGAVTGCNAVFLLNEDDRCAMKIPLSDVQPIVARSRHVPGLHVGTDELIQQGRAGQKTWLLVPRSIDKRGTGTRGQLAKISKAQRRETIWFNKRSPWWHVQLGEPCHALFTYMNDYGPKLVLARDGLHCTNTLHRVRFKAGVSGEQQMAAALTMISTFGQLAAERLGRSYGGGVLKFELNEARRMPILLYGASGLEESFRLADQALRARDRETARAIADTAVLSPRLGVRSDEYIAQMNAELKVRRARRHGRSS